MQLIALCERINRLADNRCVRANANVAPCTTGERESTEIAALSPLSTTVSVGTSILVSSPSERELNALFINIDFIRERITPIASAQNKYSFREERSANGEEQKEERREGRENKHRVGVRSERE